MVEKEMNPHVQYCCCGYQFTPSLLMKIRMLIFGGDVWRCPRCGSIVELKLVNHVVKVNIVENKKFQGLWKNG